MSYFITGSNLLTDYFNITSVGALTDITPRNIGKRPVTIASIVITETSGGTPNLTIIAYDPRTPASFYRTNARPMTARETYRDEEPFVLPLGWVLQAQVSAGGASVFVNYFNPNAAGAAS